MRITLEEASRLLQQGEVVAVPTETVYGLAAALNHPEGIAKIYSMKGRPSNNPLIVHLPSLANIHDFVKEFPVNFFDLASAFWPGPLTIVLKPVPGSIHRSVTANLSTAAFRVPNHPLTLKLLQKTGPLVMPSANLSGKPSATCPAHVEQDFGINCPVLDGGVCVKGLESTILYYLNDAWKIIRLGSLAPEDLQPILGYLPQIDKSNAETVICPGQLYKHYAPEARLKLIDGNIDSQLEGVLIGFDDRQYPKKCRVISLGPSSCPEPAAQRLYTILRQLDDEKIVEAWVDIRNLPQEGLWLTLIERLYKASAMK